MSKSAQDQAKRQLEGYGYGTNIWSIPGVNGIGIGRGHVLVTTAFYHPLQDQIPDSLEGSFEGLPVVIEVGEPEPLQRGGSQGGGRSSGVLQGGVKIGVQGEYGTCTGVFVDAQGQKYACTSSHVFMHNKRMGDNVQFNNQTVGKVMKDARKPCGGNVYLDIAAALLNQGVNSSFSIIGLGLPKGFEKPAVGMKIHSNGQNSGPVDQQVKTINYSLKNEDTGGSCPVNFQDAWLGSVRSRPGESGSAFWNDSGNLVGICTTNISSGSMNGSLWYLPQVLGLNIPGATEATPSPQKAEAQRRRLGGFAMNWPFFHFWIKIWRFLR